jgi:hypothetical protein
LLISVVSRELLANNVENIGMTTIIWTRKL